MLFRHGVMLLWPHRVWPRYNNAIQPRIKKDASENQLCSNETLQLSVSDIICCVGTVDSGFKGSGRSDCELLGDVWRHCPKKTRPIPAHLQVLERYMNAWGDFDAAWICLSLVFPTVNAPLSLETLRPLGFDRVYRLPSLKAESWSRSPILHPPVFPTEAALWEFGCDSVYF